MATKNLTSEQLRQFVLAEANKIKAQLLEDDAYKILEDPIEQDMNQNDGLGDSTKALVFKNADKTESKGAKAPAEVKMNQNAKDQGSDAKAATAIEVKAGAEKGGKGVTAGQHKANFDSKEGNPKKDVSKPFVETNTNEMNTMDALTDKDTKTYVEAGAEKGGKGVTSGQHKAVVKEKAPVSKNDAPIAKGIQTDQGNSNQDSKVTLKESYTRQELIKTIRQEALKLVKKSMLEEQLKRVNDELSKL